MNNKKKIVIAFAASLVLVFSPFVLTANEEAPATTPIRQILEKLTPEQIQQLREALQNNDPQARAAAWAEMRAVAAQQQETTGENDEEAAERLNGLELRSIMSLPGEGLRFSIHDPLTNATSSLAVGQIRNGITLKSYNASSDTVTLSINGKEREVGLSHSQVQTLAENPNPQGGRAQWQANLGNREQREARMEQVRQIRERWDTAARNDPELRRIGRAFEQAGNDARRAMGAAREAGATPEQMRELGMEMRQEFQELGQQAGVAMRNNPAFEGMDLDGLEGMPFLGGFGGPGGATRGDPAVLRNPAAPGDGGARGGDGGARGGPRGNR